MNRATAWILAAFLVIALPGCGDDSPTAPNSGFPNVAGTYRGTINFTANAIFIAAFQAQMNVVQSGSQLTITGSLTIQGTTIQIPAITGNVNQTGFFTATAGGAASSSFDPTCGTIRTTSATLTFTGNTARYVELATTTFCGEWNLSGTLSR